MRAMALLACSLLVFGAFTGCIGNKKDDPIEENSVPDGTTPGATTTTKPPEIKVLAPLTSTLTLDAPAWVQTGTEVPVKLTAPSNAKGAVTYAWAIGALPGTSKVSNEVQLDTKLFDGNGASRSLKFVTPGVYPMHCHPHPWMFHNVTVVEGYKAPAAVDVYIVDGKEQNEYRFVPENIVVAPNTVVTYHNVGALPHTATSMASQSPPLKLLPLAAADGKVKVDGTGWQRIVAILTDGEGRLGLVEKGIYATEKLPSFEPQTKEISFEYGKPTALAPVPVPDETESFPIALAQPGFVSINYTFSDAPSSNGAPENLAQIDLHFTKDGETQDTLTGGPDPEGGLSGKAVAGAYTLKLTAIQGAGITGTVTIEVVYDLVPPAPALPAEGAAGHGGPGHTH